jgi:chemotaxis protein CheD
MMKQGAVRKRLKAKIFGGGTIVPSHGDDNFFCVGEVNSRFIQEFLHTEDIPVLSSDLGGELGRVIHFYADTYNVFRRLIPKGRIEVIERSEHRYWKEEVDKNILEKPAVVFFK